MECEFLNDISDPWIQEKLGDPGSGLGAAFKAAYLAGENPAPGIAYLPG